MSASSPGAINSRRRQVATALKLLLGVGVIVAVVWYLGFYESAADNDVIGGLDQLRDGFTRLPGLIVSGDSYRSWWDFMTSDSQGFDTILGHTVDHAQLVLTSMVAATLIAVVLGIIGHRITVVGNVATALAGIALTVPSLALFAILLARVGIGDRGPIIALTMYSVLPILRNTITGLNEVNSAVIESAKGVGMSAPQRLLRIELPLAWPVILTGIRVATLLNIGIAAIAVLVGGTGLGYYINQSLNLTGRPNSIENMWTGVVFTVLLALIADLLFTLVRYLTTSKGLRK